jgi:hypothetical protein
MCKEVTREFNIEWKHTDWVLVAADGNESDLMKIADTTLLNDHGKDISIQILKPTMLIWMENIGSLWNTNSL